MKEVTVVLVTYNGEEDIGAFLETYRAHTPAEISLIIVDNASSDRTVDIVRELYPGAEVLQNTINHGFAGGARQGMEYALAHGAEYIAIVNQDLRFTGHWLEPLVEYLGAHEPCAAVQPRIMMYPDIDVINSYGNAQHYLGFGYTLGYKNRSSGRSFEGLARRAGTVSVVSMHGHNRRASEHKGGRRAGTSAGPEKEFPEDQREGSHPCENGKELATCSGAATLFRASALRDVGLIDEKYFMYYEDSDLSWRLRMAGYMLALCCDSTVYHRYEFSRSIQKFYFMERNRLITVMANYSLRTLLLIAPMMLVMEAGMMGYSILGSVRGSAATLTAREKLRTYVYFFLPSSWRYILSKRRAAQRVRKVSDKEIVRLFADTIEFQDIDNAVLRRFVNPLTHWYWTWISRII